MAGTDDRPDGEGPGPGPDDSSGPDDGPTPDDADPPVPDDDGEPGPDDSEEDDPPGEGGSARRNTRRTLELVTIIIAVATLLVGIIFSFIGTVLSYRSVIASRDSVQVARQELEAVRQAEQTDTLKDLARITFDVRIKDDSSILSITNGSARPFEPAKLEYFFAHASAQWGASPLEEAAGASKTLTVDIDWTGGVLPPCSQTDLGATTGLDSYLQWIEEEHEYNGRSIDGTDFITGHRYAIGPAGVRSFDVAGLASPDDLSGQGPPLVEPPVGFTVVDQHPLENC